MISFCKNKPKENGNFNIGRPVTSSTSMDTSPPGGTWRKRQQICSDSESLERSVRSCVDFFLRNRRGFSVSRCINLVGYAQVDEFPLTNVSAGQNSGRVRKSVAGRRCFPFGSHVAVQSITTRVQFAFSLFFLFVRSFVRSFVRLPVRYGGERNQLTCQRIGD